MPAQPLTARSEETNLAMSNKPVNESNDTGNRGIIEVSGKSTSKKILSVIAVLVGFFVAFLLILILWPKKEPVQTGMEKTNEALISTPSSDNSISSAVAEMRAHQAQEKADEEARKAKEEDDRKAQSAGSDATAQPETSTMQNVATGAASNSPSPGTPDDGKDKPLTKAQRQLTGETMVAIDNQSGDKPALQKDELQGGEYADGSVSPILRRKYLLPAGASLSCVLITKIITAYPGVTLCQLTKDVYSDNGETLLARKGSELIGEQKQAMVQGNARVFVNWTTLKADNVSVRIGALGTDSLGASGLPAWVDTHFLERFGGALMLSLIGDTMDSLKNMSQKSSDNKGSITYDNSSDASKELARTTLENSINIPPTAYINQGTVLSVIVPRNIDFSTVYEVR